MSILISFSRHPKSIGNPNWNRKVMKTPLGILVSALLCFSTSQSDAAGPPPAALKTFMEREGFGGAPLQRRFGNHLFANTVMNGRRTALMIDSGCPVPLIDRSSAAKIGLRVQETRKYIDR